MHRFEVGTFGAGVLMFEDLSTPDIIQLAAVLGAAVSAAFSARAASSAKDQAVSTRRQTEILAKDHQLAVSTTKAQSLFQISDKWTAIYPSRNAVLASRDISKTALLQKYGNDYSLFLNSEEDWTSVREVCNFFEFLGMLVQGDFVDKEHLFVVVTVDRFDDPEYPDGILYSKLKGRIEYLRQVYRSDIYEYYDKFLLPEYRAHAHVTEKTTTVPLEQKSFGILRRFNRGN